MSIIQHMKIFILNNTENRSIYDRILTNLDVLQ